MNKPDGPEPMPPARLRDDASSPSRMGSSPAALSPSPAATSPLGAMPNAVDLLLALRHRWALALSLGVVLAATAGVGVWFVLPAAEYSAQTLLLVAEQQPHIIFKTTESQAGFGTYQQTQLTMLRSRLVLNAALRDPEVARLKLELRHPDPIAWLEKEIRANYQGEVLRISMDGPNPGELATLVNAITDAYINEVVNDDVKKRRVRYEKLKEIYSTYEDRLQEKRKQLQALADQLGSSDRDTVRYAQELVIQRRELAEQELMQAERELRRLKVLLEVRGGSHAANAPAVTPSAAPAPAWNPDEDPVYQELAIRLTEAQERYQYHRRRIKKPNDPVLRQSWKEILSLKADMEDHAARARTQLAESPTARPVLADAYDLALLREEFRVQEELQKLTKAEIDGLAIENVQKNRDTWMLEQIQDEIAQLDTAAQKVGSEVEVLNIELNAPERVQLAEKAEAPRLQEDKRLRTAGMAGVGAFGLVALGVSLLEYRTRRVRTVHEVVHGLRFQLVGTLPALPSRRAGALKAAEKSAARWRSQLLESVDTMRTLLLRAAALEEIRVVMVTSAMAGEGKTSLSSHLATSLARSGRRTLLIDADLRKPDVRRLFDLADGPGLSEVLRGEVECEDAIQPSPATNLWILSAGHPDDAAVQGLALPVTGQLFDRLRGEFDFVVVDTAPVLPVADSLLVGQHADVAVYSVLRGVSRVPKVQAAVDRLRASGVSILGAVMAGVDGDLYGSSNYYNAAAAER